MLVLNTHGSASAANVDAINLVELLRWRAARQPDDVLYRFLEDGETELSNITYGQLDSAARSIAATLQVSSPPGTRALLLYPAGLEFVAAFLGCLYAGIIAVPVYPPNPQRPDRGLGKFRAIALNSGAKLALTISALLAVKDQLFSRAPDLQSLEWVATDQLGEDFAEQWNDPAPNPDTVALLQYTSGSTGSPKGVIVTHGNLIDNQKMIYQSFQSSEQCTGVSWLPMYHDMGLIGTTLQPLFAGYPFVLMSPVDFLQRPARWLKAISDYRATTSGGPNFAYDLCVRKVTPEQMDSLDLSCWELAFNGAEPIRHETMQAFTERFRPCGFKKEAWYPCYGMAEATLFVTGGLKQEEPATVQADGAALLSHRFAEPTGEYTQARTLTSCGKPWLSQRVLIVDPETLCTCPPGHVGEIWISGPSVAQGYWDQPELSQETFECYTADTCDGPFLRTGDLGFLKNGELYVTGRRKDMIIIHGRNYYPQDIERTVEHSHPSVRYGCSAVISFSDNGEERLVAIAEVERAYQRACDPSTDHQADNGRSQAKGATNEGAPLDANASGALHEIACAIRREVATEHDLPLHAVVLLKATTIPKTSSGKIQRYLCLSGYREKSLNALYCVE